MYRILCVGAHARDRSTLEEALADYHTVFAVNGLEALRVANRDVFHAYVLDYWLPDWSGLQACRHIRKTDPKVPIAICGAPALDDYRARAFRARATLYFSKPTIMPTCNTSFLLTMALGSCESVAACRFLKRKTCSECLST